MKKMTLVVMAAGLGSRYGGSKQTDSFGEHGELIIDYSIYDAITAGFNKVVFVINHSIEENFKNKIGKSMEKRIQVDYAFQELTSLPAGITIDRNRVKPLGTAHAVYSALDKVEGPFLVINADDFYGRKSFEIMANYLRGIEPDSNEFAMTGFLLKNTVSKEGYVSRGVCKLTQDNYLESIIERPQIETFGDKIYYLGDNKQIELPPDTIVSMNMWGFTSAFSDYLKENFTKEINAVLAKDKLKGEYYLPFVVSQMLEKKLAKVKVLASPEKWYGVTYPGDKEKVVNALAKMVEQGVYKAILWS